MNNDTRPSSDRHSDQVLGLDTRSSFTRLRQSFQNDSVFTTLSKIARYPFTKWQEQFLARFLRDASRREIFDKIYEMNYWRNGESLSGDGSTLNYTENLRKQLPNLIKALSINTIYDAPCGDFNWMRGVVSETKIHYIGADIVPSLIEASKHFQSSNISFSVADITVDKFPRADLWICRDCFIHLSNKDIYLALKNFLASEIPYLLTTTHITTGNFTNCDIYSGGHRLINLFSAPFYFPKDVKFRIDDWIAPFPPREMCMWTRGQIGEAASKMGSSLL